MPRIVKRDGRRVPFDEDKLRMGIGKALEKRPVSIEQIEELLGRVKQQLLSSGEREVNSQLLGELIMLELKKLDEVAYVRFASVYCRFQDVSAFRQEIDRMQKESKDVTTL
jgi:transcriptional repressor NrdR